MPDGLFCDVNGERELVDGRRMKKKRKYGGCEPVSRIDLIPEEYERVRGADALLRQERRQSLLCLTSKISGVRRPV